jgi:hypothetical protein
VVVSTELNARSSELASDCRDLEDRMTKTLVGAAVLLLAVTACGGKAKDKLDAPLTGDDKAAASSISDYWVKAGITKKASDCLGEKYIREFGVAHLKDLKILDDSLKAQDTAGTAFKSKTDAPKAATMIVDCLTLPALMKQQDPNVDDRTAQCLADAYGRDRMIRAITASLEGTPAEETPADVAAEMSKCVPNK